MSREGFSGEMLKRRNGEGGRRERERKRKKEGVRKGEGERRERGRERKRSREEERKGEGGYRRKKERERESTFDYFLSYRGIEIRALDQKIQVQVVRMTDTVKFIASSK